MTETDRIELREEERRRADNQIWNAAGEYDFMPLLRVYDEQGNAQLYWNSIIGAVRKHYGQELDILWEAVHRALAEDLCTQLVWIGLENACFERETRLRPALCLLRKAYALKLLEYPEKILQSLPVPYGQVFLLHFSKAADMETMIGDAAEKETAEKITVEATEAEQILNKLEFSGKLSGREIAEEALRFLDERTLLIPKPAEAEPGRLRFKRLLLRKKSKNAGLSPIRHFEAGIGEYGNPYEILPYQGGKHLISDMSEKQSEAAIYQFVQDVFGTRLLSEAETERAEHLLCRDEHEGCHLYFADGDGLPDTGVSGYAGILRRDAARRIERNRSYFKANEARTRIAVRCLTEKLRNAFLTYRQDNRNRSDIGVLRTDRIWRSEVVRDPKIFERISPTDDGNFKVDILLDASLSQEERQERVALQGYIIAQSLTGCGIPVRISSFCSLSGYTVWTRYRDYKERDRNERVFNFTTFGGNRDGLAIRLLGHLIGEDPEKAEHHMVLILSDIKPNDAAGIRVRGKTVLYHGEDAAENTAREVRLLKNRGISVLCVYTGTDTDLTLAHKVYNRDFVRIRDLEHFSKAVGNLILTQIRG